MSSLFKHLRVHQIFGANTDVGKTVITTALLRASASRNREVFYLKPVSTGPDSDDEFDTVMSLYYSQVLLFLAQACQTILWSSR